jgi:serine/threonine-protein kinase
VPRRRWIPIADRQLAAQLVLIGSLVLVTGACDRSDTLEPSEIPPPRPTTGQLSFSTTASKGWSSMAISVDGVMVGTLSAYVLETGSPSCVQSNGRVVTTVSPGSHTFAATANTGATWSGTASVGVGECLETRLTCPNDDCSPLPRPAPTCSVVAWACSSGNTFGAIAYSPSAGSRGWSHGYNTRAAAENRALQECGHNDCRVAVWFLNQCGALAHATNGPWGWGLGSSRSIAESTALANCAAQPGLASDW